MVPYRLAPSCQTWPILIASGNSLPWHRAPWGARALFAQGEYRWLVPPAVFDQSWSEPTRHQTTQTQQGRPLAHRLQADSLRVGELTSPRPAHLELRQCPRAHHRLGTPRAGCRLQLRSTGLWFAIRTKKLGFLVKMKVAAQ